MARPILVSILAIWAGGLGAWGVRHESEVLDISMVADLDSAEQEHASLGPRTQAGPGPWPILPRDVEIMKEVVAEIQTLTEPLKVNWWGKTREEQGWHFEADSKTIGGAERMKRTHMNVRLYDTPDKESLAIHMLFFHGIGILLASAAAQKRTTFHAEGLEALTKQIEVIPEVVRIKGKLMMMSFSGLRNMHSYDHQESERLLVDHLLDGLKQSWVARNSGNDATKPDWYDSEWQVGGAKYLNAMERVQEYGAGQPMQCQACLDWLTGAGANGKNPLTEAEAKRTIEAAEKAMYESVGKAAMPIRFNVLQPQYAGSGDSNGDLLGTWVHQDFTATVTTCNKAECCINADVDWGEEFWTSRVTVPVDADCERFRTLEAQVDKQPFLNEASILVEKYVKSFARKHRDQMAAHHALTWAAELADWWLKVSGFREVFGSEIEMKDVLQIPH